MSALTSLLAIVAVGSQLGTVKGHVNMKGLGRAAQYEVHFITRPPKGGPGQMSPMIMRLALSTPLGARGDFVARLQPGTYEVDLWLKKGPAPAPLPQGMVIVREGRTSRVTLRVPPPPPKRSPEPTHPNP